MTKKYATTGSHFGTLLSCKHSSPPGNTPSRTSAHKAHGVPGCCTHSPAPLAQGRGATPEGARWARPDGTGAMRVLGGVGVCEERTRQGPDSNLLHIKAKCVCWPWGIFLVNMGSGSQGTGSERRTQVPRAESASCPTCTQQHCTGTQPSLRGLPVVKTGL